MKHLKRRALPALLAATLLLGTGAAVATGGDKKDPLITLSYLEDTVIPELLDALNERGVLERCRSEKDRRIVNVRLLPEGQELADRLRTSICTQVMEWPRSFSHSDIKRLNNALAYLVEMGAQLAESERSENQ